MISCWIHCLLALIVVNLDSMTGFRLTNWHMSIRASSIFLSSDCISDESGQFSTVQFDTDKAKLEAIICKVTENETKLPIILFIHGSFHSGWCWKENFMSYFATYGYSSCSISLRGTNGSIHEQSSNDTVQITDHISDLKVVLKILRQMFPNRADPIIIAHSFGGLITMKLLEEESIRSRISGTALLCSVPPSGNGPMTKRFLVSRFIASLKIVFGFVFKAATWNANIARELFFDSSIPDSDIVRYMTKFKADSVVGLDVASLGPYLPGATSANSDGRAQWLTDNLSKLPKRLVIGAEKDYIVDIEGVKETALYLGVSPVIIEGAYHDLMLGPAWSPVAKMLLTWMQDK